MCVCVCVCVCVRERERERERESVAVVSFFIGGNFLLTKKNCLQKKEEMAWVQVVRDSIS